MSDEQGYTVAELVMATFIFGLIIHFIIPIFQEISADANEQTATLESTQLMVNEVERLTQDCVRTESGFTRIRGNAVQTVYQLKWKCEQLQDSLIRVHVEVQWKDKQGKFKNRQIETHRYLPNVDSPT